MTKEKSRDAFQRYILNKYPDDLRDFTFIDDEYLFEPLIQFEWLCWQASRADILAFLKSGRAVEVAAGGIYKCSMELAAARLECTVEELEINEGDDPKGDAEKEAKAAIAAIIKLAKETEQ